MTLYAPRPTKVSRPTRAMLIQDAKERGVTALECEACGGLHPLSALGYPCNLAHPDNDQHDGEPCGCWNLREVKPLTLSLRAGSQSWAGII